MSFTDADMVKVLTNTFGDAVEVSMEWRKFKALLRRLESAEAVCATRGHDSMCGEAGVLCSFCETRRIWQLSKGEKYGDIK